MGGGATELVEIVHDNDGGEQVVGLAVEAPKIPAKLLHCSKTLEKDIFEDGKIPSGEGGIVFWVLHGRRGGGGGMREDDEADRLGYQSGVLMPVDEECLLIWLGLSHLVAHFKAQTALTALSGPQEADPVDAVRS